MKKLAPVCVALSLLLAVPLARAEDDEARAKGLYKSGVGHYQKGEYKAAVKDLRAADDLVHSPALAYNIAQAYRLMKDCKEALTWYRTYLERDPIAPNKDKVNEQIAAMVKCLPKKEEPFVEPPAAPAEPPVESKTGARVEAIPTTPVAPVVPPSVLVGGPPAKPPAAKPAPTVTPPPPGPAAPGPTAPGAAVTSGPTSTGPMAPAAPPASAPPLVVRPPAPAPAAPTAPPAVASRPGAPPPGAVPGPTAPAVPAAAPPVHPVAPAPARPAAVAAAAPPPAAALPPSAPAAPAPGPAIASTAPQRHPTEPKAAPPTAAHVDEIPPHMAPDTVPLVPAAPEDDPGSGKKITGLVLVGLGAASIATGVVFGLQARGAADDVSALSAQGGTWTAAFADKEASGQRDQTISSVTLALGGTAILAGGILYYLGATQHTEVAPARPPVEIGLLPGGVDVVTTWRW